MAGKGHVIAAIEGEQICVGRGGVVKRDTAVGGFGSGEGEIVESAGHVEAGDFDLRVGFIKIGAWGHGSGGGHGDGGGDARVCEGFGSGEGLADAGHDGVSAEGVTGDADGFGIEQAFEVGVGVVEGIKLVDDEGDIEGAVAEVVRVHRGALGGGERVAGA